MVGPHSLPIFGHFSFTTGVWSYIPARALVKDGENGTLTRCFRVDTAMEVDGTNLPRTSWIKAEKRDKVEKHARIAKKQRRKPRNTMAFPKNRVMKKKT